MKIKIGTPWCFTEQGRKDNQEDYLWPTPENAGTPGMVFEGSPDGRVFLMCDGVGGRDSGEVASKTAANAIGDYITRHFDLDTVFTKEDFAKALSSGYDALDKVGNDSLSRMATTMTCLVLHKGGAMMAHIGDSRIYQVRPSLANDQGRAGIVFQTTDHSLVNDLLRIGELTEEEAANFPQKNVITRAMQPHLENRYKADVHNEPDVKPGDYFFLCCDGVLEQLTNDKLGEILADKKLDDKGKIEAIKAICDGNTRDNYTCWLIPIKEVEMEATDTLAEDDDVVAGVVEEGTVPATSRKDKRWSAPREQTKPMARIDDVDDDDATGRSSRFINLKLILTILLLVAVAALLGYYIHDMFAGKSDGEKLEGNKVEVKQDGKSDRENDRKGEAGRKKKESGNASKAFEPEESDLPDKGAENSTEESATEPGKDNKGAESGNDDVTPQDALSNVVNSHKDGGSTPPPPPAEDHTSRQ